MAFRSQLIRSLVSPPRRSLPDPHPPDFSREVRRKALLIGVSYIQEEYLSNPQLQLRQGPQNDVNGIRTLLEETFKFKKEDITVLTDFPNVPRDQWPTKMNVETAIHSFVDGAKAGDIHFLFYAGHGHQIPNDNSHEDDKRDEHIVPCDALGPDFIEEKMIIDDLLKNILVMPIAAADANLTAVFDCCHSGTVLDLSHYRCNDCTSWTRTAHRLYRHVFSKPSVNLTLMVPFTMNMFGSAAAIYLDPHIKDCKGFCLLPKRRGPGCVVCISACRDEEHAWGGSRGGSLTRAFIRALEHNPKPTLKQLNVFLDAEVTIYSKHVEKRRKQKQKQKADAATGEEGHPSKIVQRPQISSLWPLDMNQRFML
ncbi:caspase domain-containing protein [Desarmillaria ectypa]|nr:caspase domain-containing protein [Desarmillaria ectypa]